MTVLTLARPAHPPTPRPAMPAPSDSTPDEIDAALATLRAQARAWVETSISDRLAILAELLKDTADAAPRWAELGQQAEGLEVGSPQGAEEWLAGPYLVMRNLRLLTSALQDVEDFGQPRIPGPVLQRANGRLTAQVFPVDLYDRIFYSGITAEVWMDPAVRREDLDSTMAVAYKRPQDGQVCLVLGAGNVSSIGPMDVLYKLFVENKVVVLKMHPVNAYLGPLFHQAFQALVDWGVLRIVYGGAGVGQLLCEHPEVDEIHITGSDKTVEAIVFGAGDEGRRRKAERRPRNTRPISSELGNVSPVIVVPGPWTSSDLDYHAENVVSMLTNNAGFNCNAARVVIQHEGWPLRDDLWKRIETKLATVPPRVAYYPGAAERYREFLDAHPESVEAGQPAGADELPWALVPNVDPAHTDDVCFTKEAFCGVMAQTVLAAPSTAEFLARAVAFCNDTLWGTLNATLLVHPRSLADRATRAAFDRALEDLRYGTVAINAWAAVGYGLVVTPWGAYPGHDLYDVGSGTGVVHNTLMFDAVEKTVVRTPFRMQPKPMWFPSHRTAAEVARRVTGFEAAPSLLKLPGIFWNALRG